MNRIGRERAHSQISAVRVTTRSRGLPPLPGSYCDAFTSSLGHCWLQLGLPGNGPLAGLVAARIGRSALACEDACAGTGCEGPSTALAMPEVKDHLQDQNMSLNCGNVELRGRVSVRAPASGRDRDQGQRDSPPEVPPFVDHRPGALWRHTTCCGGGRPVTAARRCCCCSGEPAGQPAGRHPLHLRATCAASGLHAGRVIFTGKPANTSWYAGEHL
jgi:hypothetical protein